MLAAAAFVMALTPPELLGEYKLIVMNGDDRTYRILPGNRYELDWQGCFSSRELEGTWKWDGKYLHLSPLNDEFMSSPAPPLRPFKWGKATFLLSDAELLPFAIDARSAKLEQWPALLVKYLRRGDLNESTLTGNPLLPQQVARAVFEPFTSTVLRIDGNSVVIDRGLDDGVMVGTILKGNSYFEATKVQAKTAELKLLSRQLEVAVGESLVPRAGSNIWAWRKHFLSLTLD